MKEYIKEIINILESNIDYKEKDKAHLFRLDNFVHPGVYLDVCKHFERKSTEMGMGFKAKLSKDQYAIFNEVVEFSPILKSLDSSGFVEKNQQMTAWRNVVANQKGILFLMGTESVPDKGGLADFYKVSPEVIDKRIGKFYSRWFNVLIDVDDELENKAVNRFLEHLFRVVPKDLFKLSSIIDRLVASGDYIPNAQVLIEEIGKSLVEDWGLPSIHSIDSRSMGQLRKGKKFDLIEKANKFKNRSDFKDGFTKSKLSKLQQKINDFKDKRKGEEFPESMQHVDQLFGSFSAFESALVDYFKGKNLEVLREKLFQLDFNFINTIINFKITKDKHPINKEGITKVYGSPIEAFSKMIFNCISILEELGVEGKPVIQLNVVEAILSNYIGDVDNDLYNAWSKICFATGGLVEYLQEEWNEKAVISYQDEIDPFKVTVTDNISIKPTKGTQTLSNITFLVTLEGAEKPLEYKWIFSPNEYWLNTFDTALLDSLLDAAQSTSKFLPIFYSDMLGNLLSSVDEDIFFYQLNESSQKFVNVFDLIPPELQEGRISSRLYQISRPFREFLSELKNNGFYNTINSRKVQSAQQFISKYIETLHSLITNVDSIDMLERKYLHLVMNLFFITESTESMKEIELNGAIIPPIHPAMLEKIIEQQAFYRKGLSGLFDELSKNNAKQYSKLVENISRQAVIISGIDTIVSKESYSRIAKKVFGYYALHGEILTDNHLESTALLDNDLIYDEDFNTKEMLTNSFMSHLIKGKLSEYIDTFPAQSDCIKIGFLNFEDLQPVVAGVHAFIEDLKEVSHTINIKLQIISPNYLQNGKNYVNFWLDNFFNEEDKVKIETYYRSFNLEIGQVNDLNEILLQHDMIFINDVMSTGKISYRHTGETNIKPSETRFPMVFNPMPVYEDDMNRRISISQRQFQAAFIHSQLTHLIEYPDSKEGVYRVEKELYMSPQIRKIIDFLHENARWVITLDTALDKRFFDSDKVISFSTGEGPYGELNMTVSSSDEIREDVVKRLMGRLRDLFPSWNVEKLTSCAKHCLEQSKELDGIKLLKALNPRDYEAHSFLSYILSVNSLGINTLDSNVILRAYIPLDTYRHWFIHKQNRPDYLLVEIKKDGISSDFITIDATVIECKMGKESLTHIDKGIEQLTASISYLSQIFDGNSFAYNRRYWFAQLHRALVFSQNFVSSMGHEQIKFNTALFNILDGNFKINWSAKLLTYWLDRNAEGCDSRVVELENGVECIHESFGQLYIQKCLLSSNMSNEIFYEDIDENLVCFSNNKEDFEELISEYRDVLESSFVDKEDVRDLQNGYQDEPVNQCTDDQENLEEPLQKYENKLVEQSDSSKELMNEETIDLQATISQAVDNKIGKLNLLNKQVPLEKVRILLGQDTRTRQDVYWEYGHKDLENRHILISGRSGVGKTYFIQSLLYEMCKNGISSIIFDYTDGFKKSKLEPEFKEELKENIEQFLVFRDKFPINPFKRSMKELDEDEFLPESNEDIAERIKGVFSAVYKDIGSQQANALYQATKEGLHKYGDEMDLYYLGVELEALGTSYAVTTLSKLQSIIDRNPFDKVSTYNWDVHLGKNGKVFIVQLTGFNRDVQLLITEFILWDLWNYLLSHGDKNKPFPAIIDEAQNLDHSEKSPSAKILTEGRKFGWSGWYATQFMQGQLGKDEIQRLQNASQKIYFAPPEEEITNIAAYLDTDSHKRKEWAKKLSGLRKGQCIVWGPTLNTNGNLERIGPRVIDVTSFAERIENQ